MLPSVKPSDGAADVVGDDLPSGPLVGHLLPFSLSNHPAAAPSKAQLP